MRVSYTLLLVLPVLISAGSCPVYNCTALESNVCARVFGGVVTVSTSTCSSGYYCSYAATATWVSQTLTLSDQSSPFLYLCQNGTLTLQPSSSSYLGCGTRPINKDLASGSNPKKCTVAGNNSPECQLGDKTFTSCVCGLDGNLYCVPNLGSTVYDDFWTECAVNSYKGTLQSLDHWTYWSMFKQYYVPYLTAYSCAHLAFAEFNLIDNYRYTLSGAEGKIVSAALLGLMLLG